MQGPARFAPDLEARMANPARRAQLLDLIRLVEQEETLLGAMPPTYWLWERQNQVRLHLRYHLLRAPLVLFRLILSHSRQSGYHENSAIVVGIMIYTHSVLFRLILSYSIDAAPLYDL